MRLRLLLITILLSLLSPAASMQTVVVNGGRVQVGANDVGAIFQATVTLSNAQIKGLPTSGVTVIAAEAGVAIEPILVVLYAKTSAGAYTNIDAGAFLTVQTPSNPVLLGYLPNDGSITTGSATRLSDFLGTTTPQSVRLLPYADTEGVHALGFLPRAVDTSTMVNAALQVTLDNGMAGNLTGGNAANVLQVFVVYRVISTTSPLTVTCPANISTTSSDGSAVAVTYAAPTISGGVGPTGSYDIASGSTFDPGATSSTTRVTYTASSTDGQSAACSFTVTVTNISGSGLTFGAYYVARSGSDLFSCAQAKNALTPKQTVNSALPCLAAGDTLYVRAGTYPEEITNVASGTSWSNKVRIAAYPGETVWLKPTVVLNGAQNVIWFDGAYHYIEFDGINIDGTTAAAYILAVSTGNGHDPHHIRFQNAEVIAGARGGAGAINLGEHTLIGATGSNEIINVTIHGGGTAGLCGFMCASYGVYIKGPNNLVENCDIYDTSGAFIQIYNASGDSPDGNIVRNNRLHDLTRIGDATQVWGIIIAQGLNNQIYNNLIYGINAGSVSANNAALAASGTGTKLWNNTLYGNNSYGVSIASTAVNAVAQNNIAYLNAGANYADAGAGTTHDHNLEGTDPVFVNVGAFDFHLQTSSPAKNTGVTLAGVPTDFDGIARPQGAAYDIGAYEFH